MLELVVGMTISLAIAGVAMSLLLLAQASQKETQMKNAVTRDAMYILDMIGGDMGFAGVGVPFGENLERPGDFLRPVVRVGEAQSLTFIGDLPLPNAELNGLAHIANLPTTSTSSDLVSVASEVSTCPPPASSAPDYECDSLVTTLVNTGATSADRCTSSNMGARTCPWSVGKWQPGSGGRMPVIISASDSTFVQRKVRFSGSGVVEHGAVGQTEGIRLDSAIDVPKFGRPRIGQSIIATVDRVFYTLIDGDGDPCVSSSKQCLLVRRQCWGDVPDNDSAGYPVAASPALSVNDEPAGCAAPDDGTNWEPVATAVSGFEFKYFDRAGGELATPLTASSLQQVASIQVELTIRRKLPAGAAELEHHVTRRWFIESGDAFGNRGRKVP